LTVDLGNGARQPLLREVKAPVDAGPSVIEFAQRGSNRAPAASDLDLTDWTEDELHDPLAQALLDFRIEEGRVVAQDGRAGQSLPLSLKEANLSPYSEVPPWTPGQTLLPKNPMVIKDSNKHSPTRLSDDQLSCIYLSLTPRDLSILMALYRYRYLNVFQIQQLFFPSIRSTQIRLKQLHELGVIHRWKILEAGNFHRCPSTVLLSVRGARLVAIHHEEDPKILVSRAEDAVYNSAGMLHDLQANQLFMTSPGPQPPGLRRASTTGSVRRVAAARCARESTDSRHPQRPRRTDGVAT
jgi:Replication-relaxation